MTQSGEERVSWNNIYKRLFDFKEPIAELLKGWGPPGIAEQLDLTHDGIEPADTSLITALGFERTTDKLFRIKRLDGGSLTIWLHLELQRKPDRWMALRMLQYAVAIHQRAVRENQRSLSPVLPFVLSQADGPWTAPTELSDLIATNPGSTWRHYPPSFKYYVLEARDAQIRPNFPLLSGALRAPFTSQPSDLRRAIRGALSYGNNELSIVIASMMRTFAKGLAPRERKEMQQELDPNEELDLWDVYLRNAQKNEDETARRFEALEAAYEEAKRAKAEAAKEAKRAKAEAAEEAKRAKAEAAEEAKRAKAEAAEEAKRAKAEADRRLKADEKRQLQMTLESLEVILKSRFDYELGAQLRQRLSLEEAHRAVQLAATCPTLEAFEVGVRHYANGRQE